MDDELTPSLKRVATVLEMIEIERFLTSYAGVGRPSKDRVALARAFVAKATLNLPTTEALMDRLRADQPLRYLCGFCASHRVPGKHRFSRAFAKFAQIRLAVRCHERMINTHPSDQLIGHVARDSTAIEARERPSAKPAKPEPDFKARPVRRGRPRRDDVRAPKPETRLERQNKQTLAQMISELPTACDTDTKRDSQGFKHSRHGYKLHIDTVDGDIPVTAVLTSASVHDSQVMLPLMQATGARVTYCYDLADAAYCSSILCEESRALGHVPLIDHNPRRGEKIPFAPHEAQRFKARSQAERVNARLKDSHGGTHVRESCPIGFESERGMRRTTSSTTARWRASRPS